jgi:hypothetical protein
MSLNKVLNRPMFRKEALKRGALKPIKARIGQMVGMPTGGSTAYNPRRLPVVIPGQGAFTPKTPGLFRRGIGAISRAFGIPAYAGYRGMEETLNALGVRNRPEVTIPLSVAAGYGATRLPIAASLAGTGFIPGALAVGGIEGLAALTRAGVRERERIKAMSPAEYEEFKRMNEMRALEGEAGVLSDEELFGKFVPKEKIVEPITKAPTKKDKKQFRGVRPTEEVGVVDNLTMPDNETGGKIDLDKVAKNDMMRGQGGGADPMPIISVTTDNDDKKLSNTDKKDTTKKGDMFITDTGKVNGKTYSSEIIQKAKQYQRELSEGRRSEAGLMFLANLASGLLSGKTTQGGVAGAMDVLGQALGPAANNYAIMKLKENEVENQLMGQALDIALAEYKLANQNVQTKGSLGRVQFLGPNGQVKNFDGGINENGVPYLLVQGRQIAASDLSGDDLANLYGDPTLKDFRYGSAVIKDKVDGEEAKAHRLLLQNVKSKNIVYDVKSIISATGAAGTKGNLNIFMSKLNSTLADFGLGSTQEAIAKLNPQRDQFMRSLQLGYDSGEITEAQYKKLKKAFGDSDKLMKTIEKNAKQNLKIPGVDGKLREPTTAELFELVNAQTTLAYALANSFKDTDRLTQKDVTAAEAVINILPAFGGAETAMASLLALEKDLDRSIDSTLERLKRTYYTSDGVLDGFTSLLKGSEQFGRNIPIPGMSSQQREDIIGGIQF